MDDKKCLESFLFKFWLAGYNVTFVKILKNSVHIKMEGDFLTPWIVFVQTLPKVAPYPVNQSWIMIKYWVSLCNVWIIST